MDREIAADAAVSEPKARLLQFWRITVGVPYDLEGAAVVTVSGEGLEKDWKAEAHPHCHDHRKVRWLGEFVQSFEHAATLVSVLKPLVDRTRK